MTLINSRYYENGKLRIRGNIDMGINDSRPIFHNNTTTDYFDLAKQNGYSAETFFAEFGSLVLKVKDMFT